MSMEHATEDAIAAAEASGFEVIRGDDHTLLLDFDGDGPERLEKFRNMIKQFYGIKKQESWPSKSGKPGRVHVAITTKKAIPLLERIALQAILGSDPKRELLSLQRASEGLEDVTLLFKPPAK